MNGYSSIPGMYGNNMMAAYQNNMLGASQTSIPANYQNDLYWQYFMKSLQDAEAMRKAQIDSMNQSNTAKTAGSTPVDSYQQSTSAKAVPPPLVQAAAPMMKKMPDGKIYVVADGKDDGVISGSQKFANFAKGVGGFFKGMFCGKDGKFSLLQTAKTVGMVALGVAVPAIGIGMLAVGGAAAAVTLGKGAYHAATAKTDDEAEKAWQNIGEGTTGVVLTVTGAKALKASKATTAAEALRYKGIKGYGRAVKDVYVDAGKGIKKGYVKVREDGLGKSITDGWKGSKEYIGNQWEARFKSTNAKDNAKTRMEAVYDRQNLRHETKILELEQKIAGSKNAKKCAEWRQEITDIRAQIAENIKAKSQIPETPMRDYSRANVREINNRIKKNNEEIAQIRKADTNVDTTIHNRQLANNRIKSIKESDPKLANPRNKQLVEQLNKFIEGIDKDYPQAKKLIKLEKDVNTLKNLKQRTMKSDNYTTDAYRQNQIDRYSRLEAHAKAKAKKAKGAEKTKWESIEQQAKLKKAENERFKFFEQAEQTRLNANREIADLNLKLKDVEAKIKAEKNPEKLTDLNIEKARIESEISSNKITVQTAKNQMRRGYHYQNITSYIKDNHKPIGYGTMAAASGNVEEVQTFTEEELQAMMNGFASPEEMAAYAEQQAAQAQAQGTAQTAGANTQGSTNPYAQMSSMYQQPPMGTGLEFQDLYKSPYAGLY